VIGAAFGIVVLIFLAVVSYRATQPEVIGSLAVLPLANLTGDPVHDYYADGLQDLLITELSHLPDLRLTSRQSTKRYRDSQAPLTDIARELGVDALVEGSLIRVGSTIEVTIQLVDGRTDEHLWGERKRFTRETPYVVRLITEIAEAIGNTIGIPKASPRIGGLGNELTGPVDPRAFEAYALGTTHLDNLGRNGIRLAIEQFEMAVALEPNFALAWGELALAHAMQGLFAFALPRESIEKARVAAVKAIEADGQVAIGHSALGYALMWTGNFDGACESFKEALRLNPWDSLTIHGEADCLLFDGRADEGVTQLRELLTISPFDAVHSLPLPSHLYMARRFDEAVSAATAMQTRIPRFSIHWFLAKFYWEMGRLDKALEEDRLEFELRGDTILLAALEEGLDAGGPTGAMRAMAEALVARASETYVDPFEIAETFARAGMKDEALHWLDRAVDHGSFETIYIAFWPDLDIVRDDPQYQDLLKRVYGHKAEQIQQVAMELFAGAERPTL
jgi:TolB-like protein